MSTRAIVGCTSGDGVWKAVWNHWDSAPESLGNAILDRVEAIPNGLEAFCDKYIQAAPQGWSSLARDEPTVDGGAWRGSIVNDKVVFEGDGTSDQLPDAHYLYLVDLAGRRLLIFDVHDGEQSPFFQCAFDSQCRPTPAEVPFRPEAEEPTDHTLDDAPEPLASAAEVIAAARKVYGDRNFECSTDEDTGVIRLYIVLKVVAEASGLGELGVREANAEGFEATIGDELLFPAYYRLDDRLPALGQQSTDVVLGLPKDSYWDMRRELYK